MTYPSRWVTLADAVPPVVGATYYAIETTDTSDHHAPDLWELRDEPGRTNVGREPRLYGWLGTTNNVWNAARGMVRVEQVTRDGRRARIREVVRD